jgi:Tfp pilus assembly protein PilX
MNQSSRGSTLLVTLIFILLASLLVVTLFRSTELDTALVQNQFNHLAAFEKAESARIASQRYILNNLTNPAVGPWQTLKTDASHSTIEYLGHFRTVHQLKNRTTGGHYTQIKEHRVYRITVSAHHRQQQKMLQSLFQTTRVILPKITGQYLPVDYAQSSWTDLSR